MDLAGAEGGGRGAPLGFAHCCELNLSWGWQRPGAKSLCAWGGSNPPLQHPFGVTQRSLVWTFRNCGALRWRFIEIAGAHLHGTGLGGHRDIAQEEPPRWEEGSEPTCQDSSSLQLKQGQNTGHKRNWCVYWGQLWEQALWIQAPKVFPPTALGCWPLLLVLEGRRCVLRQLPGTLLIPHADLRGKKYIM